MGPKGDAKPKGKKPAGRNRPVRPPVGRRIWQLIINHPKGVLIGAATLLGLIVVFQNWRSTPAFLLVTDVSLPFVLWALIFMVTGYATGKWLEWGWRQRKIRKGTYKPRVSAEELAETKANLEGRLEDSQPPKEADKAPAPEDDAEDPATIIDRRQQVPPSDGGADAVEKVDYWDEAPKGDGGGPEPRAKWDGDGSAPRPEGGRRGGDWSPAARHAAREADRVRHRRPNDDRYDDYGDYDDGGRDGGGAGRRYGDYQDSGRYDDYQDSGRYDDYGDYDDGRGGGGSRRGGGGGGGGGGVGRRGGGGGGRRR